MTRSAKAPRGLMQCSRVASSPQKSGLPSDLPNAILCRGAVQRAHSDSKSMYMEGASALDPLSGDRTLAPAILHDGIEGFERSAQGVDRYARS